MLAMVVWLLVLITGPASIIIRERPVPRAQHRASFASIVKTASPLQVSARFLAALAPSATRGSVLSSVLVINCDGVTSLDEVGCHPAAHMSEANEANVHVSLLLLPSILARLRRVNSSKKHADSVRRPAASIDVKPMG